LGILTPLLCQNANKVISVDVDEKLANKAKSEFSNLDNLVLKSGDGFKKKDLFSIFVSNLPYCN
jgi:16S rRNA (adenine1518-N6/adenine1519-N6)-dimethyltransferase